MGIKAAVHVLFIFNNIIQPNAGLGDNRDYHDDLDDNSDDLPYDWQDRIHPATIRAYLSDLNGNRKLANDIIFADAGTGFGYNDTSGNQTLTLWANGKVPYQISELYGFQDRFIIEQAMLNIEHKSLHCVTFIARKTEANYIHFKPGDNCSSYVGVRGGMQPVFLHPSECIQLGIVQHEILHALGLFHEHSRSDRNSYVAIYEGEIMEGHESQYRAIPNMPTFGTAYDLESLMHYGPYDFSRTVSRPVIIPRQKGVHRMGQREGLSVRDAAKLRNAYRCQVGRDDHGEQERLFPGFSKESMKAEQCALQFNEHCGYSGSTRENCTHQKILVIDCSDTMNASALAPMATALGRPPLRPLIVFLIDSQITTYSLSPVDKQIIKLTLMNCIVRDPTAKLSRFSFLNLQELKIFNCWDMRIKKSDFYSVHKLKLIIFEQATVLYLEEGTFTNLLELRAIAWHKKLPYNFGTRIHEPPYDINHIINDYSFLVRSRQNYLERIHCDCEFSWLRKWLHQKNLLKAVPGNSEIFYYATGGGNSDVEVSDVYIPIDCAAHPFPTDLGMINFNQAAFSVNESECAPDHFNSTYESLKFKETFSSFEFNYAQCTSLFGRTCRPSGVSLSFPGYRTEEVMHYYCLQFFANNSTPNLRSLDVECWANSTVREVREISFALAKPPVRSVDLSLFDGDYIVYRAFAPMRMQVSRMILSDCIGDRPAAYLSVLQMSNLLQFVVSSCRNIVLQAADFTLVPNIRVLVLTKSTVVSATPSIFAALPNLQILSLEYRMSEVLMNSFPSDYQQYLHNLHCDCEFADYRNWLQSQIIDRLHIWTPQDIFDFNTTVQSLCNDNFLPAGAIILSLNLKEYDVGRLNEWLCIKKEDLYLPINCADARGGSSGTTIDFQQRNYSINVPRCEKAVSRTWLTGWPTSPEGYANHTKPTQNDWTKKLNQQILRERRSELTTTTVGSDGRLYHYDDQMLDIDLVSAPGYLSDDKFWPNNDTHIPYLISDYFDNADQVAIQDALNSISSFTSYCITFQTRTEENDYILFMPGYRCQSQVGRQGGRQSITLTHACIFCGAIQHLVLHALGFVHEHHRADRDDYLQIYLNHTELSPDNIVFRKFPQMRTHGAEYDLESIMHLGAFDLTNPEHPHLPVLLPKVNLSLKKRIQMGQRRALSARDIVKLNTAYNCTMLRSGMHTAEPLPHFEKSHVPMEMCTTLSKLRCGDKRLRECSKSKMIELTCGGGTTSDDWQTAAMTVAYSPLRAVWLNLEDTLQRHDMSGAFWHIRRLILGTQLYLCKNAHCTSVLRGLGFVNLMILRVSYSSGLIIKKTDFCKLNKLQSLIFRMATVQNLEPGTFSNLLHLKVLSMESDILIAAEINKNLSVIHRLEYLHNLHCSCDFAEFRQWMKNNKALLWELGPEELSYVDGILSFAPFARSTLYNPVDCRENLTANLHTAINFDQLEYSINEPLCEESVAPIVQFCEPDISSREGVESPAGGGAL
ncbi:uncharacterized protein LOC129586064 [Paramacrobiotus metropolitanus]|uniref:uncharacterized protein LOC129586064 n=1 Tax=Paramacrobiotus metropolitanus TaxID=2943436 RepID=UPI002445FB12|nr:uncharacterized protein LOC129586064 [Paramacrobiotus metropolitanus]